MQRMLAAALVLAVGFLVLGPRQAEAQEVVQVLDYNIYLGADLNAIAGAPSALAASIAAGQAFDSIRFKTDYGVRVKAIADLVSRQNADVLGLQEVITYFVQEPAAATPATTVFQDFLALLLDELDRRGDHYDVACRNFNADVEFPSLVPSDPALLTDVRLLDSDVILVRDGIPITNFSCANITYTSQLRIDIPGCTLCCAGTPAGTTIPECLEFTRAGSVVEATIRGITYTIANTHLEVFGGGANCPIQASQATELIGLIAGAGGGPAGQETLLTGDFNSELSDGGCGADTFVSAGYTDSWTLNSTVVPKPPLGDPGDTCCHNSTLDNAVNEHDSRIDYVMVAGFTPSSVNATVEGGEQDQRTLNVGGVCAGSLPASVPAVGIRCVDAADCTAAGVAGPCNFGTPGGLWPADHCAVSARIRN